MIDFDVKSALSLVAIVVSFCSFLFARRSWQQSNRPIVTAFLTEHDKGNRGGIFDLVVSNTGNRPAVRVRLNVSPEELRILVDPGADPKRVKDLEQCFVPESEIPVLRNGEELTTSFGSYSGDPKGTKWLNYAAEVEIEVSYLDLEGRVYKSRLPLKVYAREGFGGSVWSP
jgi:hypothetical protein